ncbi:MAG TPA: YjbE family putative metal transport protein [Devosia sp.]|nr:YjbE family putative metal transport protein [Devosia sp.]
MHDLLAPVLTFLQVVFIDLALAGDNALVVGIAAAGLPAAQRRKAIFVGIAAATLLRVTLAGFATMILAVVGLLLAGGILLLWVCWKLYRELSAPEPAEAAGDAATPARTKTLSQAVLQIVAADVSMSLDNVLAVAGAAHDHPIVMVLGLTLSVVLMGIAASWIAKLLSHWRWIGYVGLFVIAAVAGNMIYHGALDLAATLRALHG